MLSYQHIYHAGCLADIHKHSVLAAILAHLTKKDKAITYMETHAARGLYNLESAESVKTGEAEAGIFSFDENKLCEFAPDYLNILDRTREDYGAAAYPGSPMIARYLMRDHDKMHLMELHPQEFDALKRNISGKNIRVYKNDGYKGVLSLCPPTPRRGIVLIDPSFEVKNEYDDVAEFIPLLLSAWTEATVILWYPILANKYHVPMIEKLKESCHSLQIHDEIIFGRTKGMSGSGLLVFNLPLGALIPDTKKMFL